PHLEPRPLPDRQEWGARVATDLRAVLVEHGSGGERAGEPAAQLVAHARRHEAQILGLRLCRRGQVSGGRLHAHAVLGPDGAERKERRTQLSLVEPVQHVGLVAPLVARAVEGEGLPAAAGAGVVAGGDVCRAHSASVMPMALSPRLATRAATTLESTPPDMATATTAELGSSSSGSSGTNRGSSRDRGDDGKLVALADRRVEALAEADVGVIDID